MSTTADIIRDAESLPVEGRTKIVESLLQSLNSPDPEFEQQWVQVAERRLQDLREGKVLGIPGDQVFDKVQKRFRE